MAKKEKLGKTNEVVIVTPSGTELVGTADMKGIGKMYSEWASALGGVSGSTLFMVNSPDLFEMFLDQGIVGRTHGNPSPKRAGQGGTKIDKNIRNITDGGKIDLSEIEELLKLDALMDEYSKPKSELNPRNIPFEDIKINPNNGDVLITDTVRGHYRTQWYEDKREYKIKKYPDQGHKPMPSCPSEWYKYDWDLAKPPFWQVIYGGDGDVEIVKTKSLQQIVKLAIEELKKPMGTSKDKPIKLFGQRGKTGWPKLLLELNFIKNIVTDYLDPTKAQAKSGYFKHKEVRKLIMNSEQKIPTRGKFQGETRNKLQIPEDLTVNRGYFSISRGMINQVAEQILIGQGKKEGVDYSWPDKSRKDNSLKIKDVQREDDGTKNTSFNQPVRSWTDILKVA